MRDTHATALEQGRTSMTAVTFALDLAGETEARTLDEAALADPRHALADEIDAENVDGALTIDTEGKRLVLADELSTAVINLCFDGVSQILSQPARPYLYRFAHGCFHVVMIPLVDSVRIFGEETAVVTCRQADLLPKLYQCGLRYVAFLESLGGDQADSIARTLEDRAAITSRLLTEHGLPAATT